MLNILRWLAVLPGAFVCAILALFPLHLVLYQTLTGSGIVEPYPETPERLLGPLVSALAFVWGGSRIAPFRKLETAVVLFGALLLLIGASFALGLTGAPIGNMQLTLQMGGLPSAGAVVGAFIGLHLVRRENSANVKVPEEVHALPAGEQASENSTTAKRDWLQITLNAALAGGCIFMAYQAFMHPREALSIALAVAGTMVFVGALSLAFTLIGWIIGRINKMLAVGEFDLTDRIRFWLLRKPWLAYWLPNLWDQLREDIRLNHHCEISDCWGDPEHMYEGHKVCSQHYAEILEIKAGQTPARFRR